MANKNTKKMLLFVTLCILLIGVANATDVESDDVIETSDAMTVETTEPIETIEEVQDNVINDNTEIIKNENNTKTVKTDSKIGTKISIDYIPDISVDEDVFVMGTFTDVYGNPLRFTNVKLDVNGDYYYTETDDYGDFYGEYLATTPGIKTVTVSYGGNSRYAATSTKRTFNVDGQYTTYITLNSIKEVNLGDSVQVSGYYYYDQAKPLKSTTLTLNINGAKYYAKTNNNGYFTYNYKTTKEGTNTITAYYAGNDKFSEATASKTFNVKSIGPKYTYITLNNINNVNLGQSITISGYYYYDQAKPLRSTSMVVNINGAKYYAKTNNNGYFTYNYKTNKVGTNTVTVSYPGNTNFKPATTTKTFTVKSTEPQYTYITLNSINNVQYSDYTTISGYYYYDQNKPLKSTTMLININGAKYYAKTNNNGYFTYNYKTNKVGTNTVTVSYPGNTNFKPATTTKTFTVAKKGTKTTLYYLYGAEYSDVVSIYGELKDNSNNYLKSTGVFININGKNYVTRTDSYGDFKYNYKANTLGRINVTATFNGTNNYEKSSGYDYFYVNPKKTSIYVNSISSKTVGDYANISGRYTDDDYNPLKATTVTININGKNYYAKTDNNGYYSFNYKTQTGGTNNVTVSYPGNERYRGTSANRTFTVYKISTTLTLNSISTTKISDVARISGRYTDENYNPLKSTGIKININGNIYYAKTDQYGYYSYNYKTNTAGTNYVTVSYPGTDKYSGDSKSTSFNVQSNYKTIELYSYLNSDSTKYIDGDEFSAWYTKVDGEWGIGTHLLVMPINAQGPDDLPNNMIFDATFYFKNSAGKIISKKFDSGNGIWMSHDLISGYTPYKVVAKYRKMTQEEKNLWNSDIWYNATTGEWHHYSYYYN